MPSCQNSILCRCLPLPTFARLRDFLARFAQRLKEQAPLASSKQGILDSEKFILFLNENILTSLAIPEGTVAEKFAILVSENFSVLLLGNKYQKIEQLQAENLADNQLIEVGLTFDSNAIAEFLTDLANLCETNPLATQTLTSACQIIQPNDAKLQSEFTLSLLEILSVDSKEENPPDRVYPHVWVCEPVHHALGQQLEQEQLLYQVTSQIRQSLELPVILQTAVEQVRNFLQADRLLIYQFENSLKLNNSQNLAGEESGESAFTSVSVTSSFKEVEPLGETCNIGGCWGRITYEARGAESIPSVLNFAEEKNCFIYVPNCHEKYRKGFTLAVEDVETAYLFSPCLLELMRQIKVRSKLAVPIVIQDKLWGLLIAHQCFEPRQWQASEQKFLRHIAEHLAIAIYQAQLYGELQKQKETLEERVISRTQELHDILLAAQSANRAKSEFLSTMSHELRTPLTCVIGLSATLLRWSFGQLTQKQREYLQTIHDNGEHLLELINDILELSQLEAGKTILNISEFSLSQLASQSLQNLKEKARQRGVDLSLSLSIQPQQDRFLADPKRLKQILFNLLSNGVKFTPEGGEVILRVWVEGNTAVFQVEDSGIGIPENQLPLLFEKFQQLDTSYRRQYEGTGLGLALTKQLVELHRGRVEVESTVGEGSIFTVWVPLPLSSTIGNLNGNATAHDEIPQGRIVLIENDEETATLICDILTAAGYQMVWIVEGSTALKQIEILQPLVAIVEINLQGMNGYDVIQQLRISSTIPPLKIMAIATKETLENNAANAKAKPDDYITKPIQPQHLLNQIKLLIKMEIDN
ncbi:MAG TPA: ATP-binding protein [Leptolyngbyaceae cyanobacterium]